MLKLEGIASVVDDFPMKTFVELLEGRSESMENSICMVGMGNGIVGLRMIRRL